MKELISQWACLTPGCFESGEGPDSDKQSEKHVKAFRHGTRTWTVYQEVTDADSPEASEGRPVPAKRQQV